MIGEFMDIALLHCQDISKTFQINNKKIDVLDKINLQIFPGETILLFAKSGQGKSVLLSILSGLDSPTDGDILFDGLWLNFCTSKQLENIRRNQIGIIFQNLNLIPSWTALENVQAALEDIEKSPKARYINSRSLLEEMGLSDRLNHFPKELSMGEQQRVAIARTLIRKPKLILADEPTGDLDKVTANSLVQILQSYLRKTKAALLVASHGIFPDMHFNRILILNKGKLSRLCDEPATKTFLSVYSKNELSLLTSI